MSATRNGAGSRPTPDLRPFPELVGMVNAAELGLEGLIDLLDKASESHMRSDHLAQLLRPLHQQLSKATTDLNNMRV
ncbi:DUF1484 family protein [Roseateles sp. SL47]|uniref:DUF1484 family protein n=1 Tax=Roseateles sp. SL47 TaxID=2995138 RepID=UPI00226F9155|nr:DUF1484 family protein [Roseateles sp. SL47]WAC70818.1 DUF1484 family protein [Roseateles sp. SL47]